MSVWYCIPSKRPPEEAEKCLKLWRERGYKIALWCDKREDAEAKHPDWWQANHTEWNGSTDTYPGYSKAVNYLVRCVIEFDKYADWLVTGGDDIEPDANHSAEEIAQQCSLYFGKLHAGPDAAKGVALSVKSIGAALKGYELMTFGVMQPTGDKWGDRNGPYIERVAGSPWMGREFCRRMYQGRGPLCEDYFHMGEDEELQAVATMLGVFWQRPDLIQLHNHWGRIAGRREDMPSFLERANSPEEWRKYKEIFRIRQQLNFPGHEPLEA